MVHTYVNRLSEVSKFIVSVISILRFVDGPKLAISKSAETDSPGQASIFEEEAVTLTSVEAGDTSTGRSLTKPFPPVHKRFWFFTKS